MSNSITAHPDSNTLQNYALGKLSEADLNLVCQHVALCSRCQDVVQSVPEDPFIKNLNRYVAAVQPSVAGSTATQQADTITYKAAALSLPHPIAGLEIKGILGKGGMGVVYLARDTALGRDVALKMIRDADADEKDFARFREEAKAVAALTHDNIARIYQLGESEGRPYFVMEYVDGTTLAKKIAGTPLEPRQAAAIAKTLAEAIQYAHDHGVIHRDLKPGNVLFTAQGMPKVADFGLAKRVQPGPGKTIAGAILGTPSYMAPEQAAGRSHEVTASADVYGLGAILYEMLTGRPPFKADTPVNTLMQVLADEPKPPRQRNHAVPRDLETICLKCLQKDPKRRYASAKDLAADLRRYMRGEPIQARPVHPLEHVLRWCLRYPARTGLAAAVVLGFFGLLLAGSAGIWYAIDRAGRATEETNRKAKELEEAKKLAHETKLALDEVEHLRTELHKLLADEKALNELLNRPSAWEARLEAIELALKRADSLLKRAEAQAEPALRQRLDTLRSDLTNDRKDRELAVKIDLIQFERAADSKDNEIRMTARAYAAAFKEAGIDVFNDDLDATAEKIRRAPIRNVLLGGLDYWTLRVVNPQRNRLYDLAKRADPHPVKDNLRDPAILSNSAELKQIAQNENLTGLSSTLLRRLSAGLESHGGSGVDVFKQAVTVRPTDFWLNYRLGTLLAGSKHKRYEEGLRYLQSAAALRPDEAAEVHDKIGIALTRIEDSKGAVEAFQKAVRLRPDFAAAWNNLALALSDERNYDDAIDAFQRAIKLSPTSDLHHSNFGVTLGKAGEHKEAIQALEKAVELGPRNPSNLLNLGGAWSSFGDHEKAMIAYEKGLDLTDKDAGLYNNIGVQWEGKRDFAKAKDYYLKAIALKKDYDMAHRNLGDVCWELGDKEGAEKAYLTALELNPRVGIYYRKLYMVLKPSNSLKKVLDVLEPKHKYAIAGSVQKDRLAKQIARVNAIQQLWDAEPLNLVSLETLRGGVAGKLAESDPLDIRFAGKKCHRKAHGVKMERGKSYQIDLESDQFDTYLRVEGSDYHSVLENDDVNLTRDKTGLNSRVVFSPQTTDVYHLVVTSFESKRAGSYVLRVIEVVKAGPPVVIEGKLTKDDKTIEENKAFYKDHRIDLRAHRAYTIELESKRFDTLLFLLDPSGKTEISFNDDIAPDIVNLSRVDFTPAFTGNYLLRAAAHDRGRTGPYVLRIQGYEPAPEKKTP